MTATAALHDLRRARRRNRLADLEWFEAAYRVYLVAIVAGAIVLYASDLVGDAALDAAQAARVARHGPGVLGIVTALAAAWGLRAGSQGGPIALEAADVRHVLLAPVPRRAALARPAWQSMRSMAFASALVAAVAGQLAGRRLPGSATAWSASGAVFGATVAFAAVALAIAAHALRVPRWLATLAGAALVAGQLAAVARHAPSPANVVGSLGMWGWRARSVDLVAIAAVGALVAVAFSLTERLSLEALSRRSGLVAQLRFAVTMQDLRTVVLLRRQLSQEQARSRPWIRLRRAAHGPIVWRRGWHGLLRFPAPRIARLVVLVAAAAACQVAALRGTTPAVVGTGIALFVVGLDLLEPLSQEIDQPDRTDAFPMPRGALMARHLAAPAVALAPLALVVVGVVAMAERSGATVVAMSILALPMLLAGAAGAVVSVVMDAPDPIDTGRRESMLPPEIGGVTTTLRLALPLVVSALSGLPVLAVRAALRNGEAPAAMAVRTGVGLVLLIAATVAWVRKRDDVRRRIRAFFEEGRAITAQQRAAAR